MTRIVHVGGQPPKRKPVSTCVPQWLTGNWILNRRPRSR